MRGPDWINEIEAERNRLNNSSFSGEFLIGAICIAGSSLFTSVFLNGLGKYVAPLSLICICLAIISISRLLYAEIRATKIDLLRQMIAFKLDGFPNDQREVNEKLENVVRVMLQDFQPNGRKLLVVSLVFLVFSVWAYPVHLWLNTTAV